MHFNRYAQTAKAISDSASCKAGYNGTFLKKQENLWDNENVNKVKFSDTYTGNKSGSLVDQFIDKVLESKVPIVEKFSNIRTSVKVKKLLMRTSSQSAQGYSFFPYECPDDVLDEIIDSVKLSLARCDG